MCSFAGCAGVVYVVAMNYMKKVVAGKKNNEEAVDMNSN